VRVLLRLRWEAKDWKTGQQGQQPRYRSSHLKSLLCLRSAFKAQRRYTIPLMG
jgi:hypothetical protein